MSLHGCAGAGPDHDELQEDIAGDLMRSLSLVGLSIVPVLLAAFTLQGCIIPFENQVARTWWHQPELWDAFPEDGEVGSYTVDTTGLQVTIKSAKRDGNPREVLGVTEDGDVDYSYIAKRAISTEQFRTNIEQMFKELSLPEPALDPAYKLGYRIYTTKGVWDQPEVWDRFPAEGQESGFDVFVHDTLKVAVKVDAWTSEWIRVNETGAVNYRFAYRGESDDHGPYSFEARNATVWVHIESSFQDLLLPSPQLNQSHDFKSGRWAWPPEVRG